MYIANNDIKLAGNRYKAWEQIAADVIAALDANVVAGLILDGHISADSVVAEEVEPEQVITEEVEVEPEQLLAEEVETVTALKDEDYKPSHKKRR